MNDEAHRPYPPLLDAWVATVRAELGLPAELSIEIAAVLDLAGVAAHSVARPAAPLTTYLAGYAAALAGGSNDDARSVLARLAELARAAEGS